MPSVQDMANLALLLSDRNMPDNPQACIDFAQAGVAKRLSTGWEGVRIKTKTEPKGAPAGKLLETNNPAEFFGNTAFTRGIYYIVYRSGVVRSTKSMTKYKPGLPFVIMSDLNKGENLYVSGPKMYEAVCKESTTFAWLKEHTEIMGLFKMAKKFPDKRIAFSLIYSTLDEKDTDIVEVTEEVSVQIFDYQTHLDLSNLELTEELKEEMREEMIEYEGRRLIYA